MSKMDLTRELKSYIKGLGSDLVGIAPVERFAQAPTGHHPEDILPQAKNVVVFAMRLLESTFASPNPRPWVMRYWQLRSRLQDIGYDVSKYLEDNGYYALNLPSTAPMDSGPESRLLFADFSYRHAGWLAGLGEIGYNSLLVTPQYGPRVWLMAVLTSAPLTPDPMLTGEVCPKARCNICVEKCPQQALSPQGINRARCVRSPGEYGLYGTLNHIRNIVNENDPDKRNEMLFGPDTWGIWMHLQYGGGPSRCRVCLESCPIGKRTLH